MPLLRFEISDASDSGRGSAPAASHSRFAYARRSDLIVGLVLLFVNGSTTASGAEANAPAPKSSSSSPISSKTRLRLDGSPAPSS